jgi:phycocyanin-associated, rod
MLGKITGNTESASRYFCYEVEGLRQNDETDKTDYEIRSSANTFIMVPYSRMNAEMQRITRMGGKIVNIKPLNGDALSNNNGNSHDNNSN